MKIRQPKYMTQRKPLKIVGIVWFMMVLVVSMTVDYGRMEGGEAHAADTWYESLPSFICCDENFDDSDGCTHCEFLETVLSLNNDTTHYIWEPEKDITVYELSLIIPVFIWATHGSGAMLIEGLPPEARRHFRKAD